MEFEIKRRLTIEFKEDNLKVNLNDLEDYISDKLQEKNYGTSVIKFFWGFELFKFDGDFAQFFKNEIESWKHSVKWLVTNSNFDWNIIKDLSEIETLNLMKTELFNSINRIEKMKRKPKDFDFISFRNDIDSIFNEYL